MEADRKAEKAERWQERKAKLTRIDRQWWIYAGMIGGAVVGFLGCQNYQSNQRDTALALASIAGGATATTTPAPVESTGMANPLEAQPLTGQAKWVLGWVPDDTPDGALSPVRSADALTQILTDINVCDYYIGLGARAEVLISSTADPGFSPLCEPTATVDDSAPVTTETTAAG